ncbi:peptide ABC transporter substrate-binding protein [Sporolactobacillus vineae]|uniref:peptide ABC transporter substrate-binding protein n=1 Tax=Sporolactobacillus vineae TaxID=444463 RepID=UPI0004749F6B|nr:peptide ABC transporter substrate-binding protein [Sporolactobacillus vineae]
MKKWFSRVLFVSLSLLLVFVFSGCTARPNASAGKSVLKLNNGSEPTTFNPAVAFDSYSLNPLNNLLEGLTRLDKTNNPKPAMAQSWTVSKDQKTYTFHIRQDAKWTNGDPVTAGDFVYSWKQLLNPKTASPAAFLGYLIQGAEAYNAGKGPASGMMVTAAGSKTLVVKLKAAQSYFTNLISNPAFFPVDAKVAQKNPKWFANAKTFVGNGPYKLTSWKHNASMVFTKNNTYWDSKSVKLDQIDWAMVNNPDTEYQMYKSGQLDSSGVPADLSTKLFQSGKVKVAPQGGTFFISMNVKKAPFQNINIRKAFAYAVDNKQITDYVLKQKNVPAYGFVSPGFKDPSGQDFRAHNGDLYKYDPTLAKSLLKKGMKEAGYKTLPKITLTYSTDPQNQAVCEAIQAMLKKNLGVSVGLANMEWNVYQSQQKAGKFQLSKGSFLADFADPIDYLLNFQTGNQMNSMQWSNKQYDQLTKEASTEANNTKRYNAMYQAEKLLINQMPLFPVYFYNQAYLLNPKVSGIVYHPVGYMELKWAAKAK